MFFPSSQFRSLLSICYTIFFIPSTLLFLLAIYFVLYQKSLASNYYKKVIVFQLVSAFIGDIMISLTRPILLMQIRIVIFQMNWDLPFVGIVIVLAGYIVSIFLSYGCFMNGSLYKIITLYSLPSYVAWLLNAYFLGGYGVVFVLAVIFVAGTLQTGGLSDDRKVVGFGSGKEWLSGPHR
ncbi:unnamed protein product, partial [Mesorhabditis belari]|uniref:Uncharacterized protein n=1 Tax=Mesorhabditis belari TaxID=2138241 RepID=A0AAF3JAU9_9BILA